MMKGEKGITLVALIITIIVMLILVAVTISIALNGGIFDRARSASNETLKAQLKEAVALAKGDALMVYYQNGGNSAAEDLAEAAFDPAQYLEVGANAWSQPSFNFAWDTEFTVSATCNNTECSVPVTINKASI